MNTFVFTSAEVEIPHVLDFYHPSQVSLRNLARTGGYGGIKHCLIPSPKHVLLNKDEHGNLISKVYAEEQKPADMMRILGYTTDKKENAWEVQPLTEAAKPLEIPPGTPVNLASTVS